MRFYCAPYFIQVIRDTATVCGWPFSFPSTCQPWPAAQGLRFPSALPSQLPSFPPPGRGSLARSRRESLRSPGVSHYISSHFSVTPWLSRGRSNLVTIFPVTSLIIMLHLSRRSLNCKSCLFFYSLFSSLTLLHALVSFFSFSHCSAVMRFTYGPKIASYHFFPLLTYRTKGAI